MATITYSELLEVTHCWCGIAVAIPQNLLRNAHNHGTTVHCPVGHKFGWHETEADRLRKQLEKEQQRSSSLLSTLDQTRARARSIERSRNALKGEVTKVKKRTMGGACPCCNRSFVQLARHMKTKHSSYVEGADR